MTRWSEESVRHLMARVVNGNGRLGPETRIAAKVRQKYGNQKTRAGDRVFDSKLEAKRFGELQLLEKAGEIVGLIVQPRFSLVVLGEFIGHYTGDFSYYTKGAPDESKFVVEDCKSPASKKARDYPLRKKLMKAIHGIEITEIAS